MVVPCGAAATAVAKVAGAASSAGATALGLSMGKTDLELTQDLFKMQMRQTKRLWTADYAINSIRHNESIQLAMKQHLESQSLTMATYYQSYKQHLQQLKLAYDQDSRAYEMSWRSEVRENLRDELQNQNNRFNIIMLCDTVCLSCVFGLVIEGVMDVSGGDSNNSSSSIMVTVYVFLLGVSIMLFTLSLWFAVIVVRRLHEHTAAILEQKLFATSNEIQMEWSKQISQLNSNSNVYVPTNIPVMMNLINKEYEKWITSYIDPLGKSAVHLMAIGVVAMFVTAGLLTHYSYMMTLEVNLMDGVTTGTTTTTITATRHLQELSQSQEMSQQQQVRPHDSVYFFWLTVIITCTSVLYMKYSEDQKERQKIGIYDNSWQDQYSTSNSTTTIASATNKVGPYAKINKTANELFNDTSIELNNNKNSDTRNSNSTNNTHNTTYQRQIEVLNRKEKKELLHSTKDSKKKKSSKRMNIEVQFQLDSTKRSKLRKDVLQLLTTATEELDALPEELTATLNSILHDIDEADERSSGAAATSLDEEGGETNDESIDDSTDEDDQIGDLRLSTKASSKNWNLFQRRNPSILKRRQSRQKSSNKNIRSTLSTLYPIDAQRLPIKSLPSIRRKLGEVSVTTLLRIKNCSDEPLRLKSGLQLKSGRYMKSLKVNSGSGNNNSSNNDTITYQLYPVSEIPSKSEVVIAARCNRGMLVLPHQFNIAGEIVYTTTTRSNDNNNNETTNLFRIHFSNGLLMNNRFCHVDISRSSINGTTQDDADANVYPTTTATWWEISKNELDLKVNSEVLVTINALKGIDAIHAANEYFNQIRISQRIMKEGILQLNKQQGLRLKWEERYIMLTPSTITLSLTSSSNAGTAVENEGIRHDYDDGVVDADIEYDEDGDDDDAIIINLKDISNVLHSPVDLVRKNVFEIHVMPENNNASNNNYNNSNQLGVGALSSPKTNNKKVYKLSASTSNERDDWIQAIVQQATILAKNNHKAHNSTLWKETNQIKNKDDSNKNDHKKEKQVEAEHTLPSTSNSSSFGALNCYDQIEWDEFGEVL